MIRYIKDCILLKYIKISKLQFNLSLINVYS